MKPLTPIRSGNLFESRNSGSRAFSKRNLTYSGMDSEIGLGGGPSGLWPGSRFWLIKMRLTVASIWSLPRASC